MQVLEQISSEKRIVSRITRMFNPEIDFGDKEFYSMLFYLGYLTINGKEFGFMKLKIPNKTIKKLLL